MSTMSSSTIAAETARRRTFAIISHPDAGKTTLTEKLLLFAGAIQIAGSVKARKAARHATSDWMEIEKQRGISVASSVMQMEYRGQVINLLDTPGHQDFSEDTYRVLTAVDAALMVIDAVNGVEAQTIRLLEVCRARNTPIITFINKLDRETKEPLEVLDEIERVLRMPTVPLTWPVGMGKRFGGVFDLRADQMRVFRAGEDRRHDDDVEILPGIGNPAIAERFGDAFAQARGEIELLQGASHGFDREAFPRRAPDSGLLRLRDQQLRRARGAGRAGRPRAAAGLEARGAARDRAHEEKFTGVVFKIQANMDPQHRDRVAFVRVCSGRFERGMGLKLARTGKEVKTASAMSFMSQRREVLDDAWPGDIIGLPNRGVLQLGDTLTEGEKLQFTGLPFFAPEIFHTVEVKDPIRNKQLRTGLQQLGEEGAIQVFRPHQGGALLLGAVGTLQLDVVAHRLEGEYAAQARMIPSNYRLARWVTAAEPAELERFVEANGHRVAYDVVDAPAVLYTHASELRAAQEIWPKITFHAMREHGGRVVHSDRLAA
jgi:peptide chain release factor 3